MVGPSNQFAFTACAAVANAPGRHYNPLFLYGNVGLGKTHLLYAVGNHVLQQNPNAQVVYISSEAFNQDLIHALEMHKMPEFRARYRERCDVLLLDDIQFLGNKKEPMEEFFYTFNALHEAGKQIVVTSDKPPHEIVGFEERLRSRFQWGLIADVQPPEVETRVAILKKKASNYNITLSEDVALFLSTHLRRNVRELEGSLIRLSAFASLTGVAITVDLAKDVLKNVLVERRDQPDIDAIINSILAVRGNKSDIGTNIRNAVVQADRSDVDAIIKTVGEVMQVPPSDIKGDRHQRELSRASQVAMYLTHKITNLSYSAIGERFGGKEFSAVRNAERQVEELMRADAEFRALLESLMRRLKGD